MVDLNYQLRNLSNYSSFSIIERRSLIEYISSYLRHPTFVGVSHKMDAILGVAVDAALVSMDAIELFDLLQ